MQNWFNNRRNTDTEEQIEDTFLTSNNSVRKLGALEKRRIHLRIEGPNHQEHLFPLKKKEKKEKKTPKKKPSWKNKKT